MARATKEWIRRLGKEYTRLTGWISHTADRFHTMTQEHISRPSFLSVHFRRLILANGARDIQVTR